MCGGCCCGGKAERLARLQKELRELRERVEANRRPLTVLTEDAVDAAIHKLSNEHAVMVRDEQVKLFEQAIAALTAIATNARCLDRTRIEAWKQVAHYSERLMMALSRPKD